MARELADSVSAVYHGYYRPINNNNFGEPQVEIKLVFNSKNTDYEPQRHSD